MADEEENVCYCTYAITESRPSFQTIFICRSCCEAGDGENSNPACVCEACANSCHADHEVEYVGVGPAYCDCPNLTTKCKIYEESKMKAVELGFVQPQEHANCCKPTAPTCRDSESLYYREVFSISALQRNSHLCDALCDEAIELVKYSKDTFWLNTQRDSACNLEKLAWHIFQNHVAIQEIAESNVTGIEWWVQVKSVSLPDDSRDSLARGEEAVDLHYDKDEVLAESFGIGSFPFISTVSYLTESTCAPPTVVFPHKYEDEEDDEMTEMLVSHPSRGKHLAFDGRLLHGAPAHFAIRRRVPISNVPISSSPRVTFLVNIWARAKPLGLEALPESIRSRLRSISKGSATAVFDSQEMFVKANITAIPFANNEDPDERRIHLPFLGKGTTWDPEDHEDHGEDRNATFVSTLAPQSASDQSDTLSFKFRDGNGAYITSRNTQE